jgi:hypothetical protein
LPCLKTKDGQVIRFLLEIKCPFSRKLYPHIPHYYYDQIQGIMGILQLQYCDFVVWTPEKTQIRRYEFNSSYWKQVLFPRLFQFYMDEYLPRLIMKEDGTLKKGELEPTFHINDDNCDDFVHISDDGNNGNNGNNGNSEEKTNNTFDFIWTDPSQKETKLQPPPPTTTPTPTPTPSEQSKELPQLVITEETKNVTPPLDKTPLIPVVLSTEFISDTTSTSATSTTTASTSTTTTAKKPKRVTKTAKKTESNGAKEKTTAKGLKRKKNTEL